MQGIKMPPLWTQVSMQHPIQHMVLLQGLNNVTLEKGQIN